MLALAPPLDRSYFPTLVLYSLCSLKNNELEMNSEAQVRNTDQVCNV